MNESLTFDDCLLVPKFSTISSRKECDTSTKLGSINLSLPIISSNMDSITEVKMSHAMANAGGLGALHRFCTIEENIKLFLDSEAHTFVSIGLGDQEFERFKAIVEHATILNVIIDVANGASLETVKQYKKIREYVNCRGLLGKLTHIMVGNFATAISINKFCEELLMREKRHQLPDSFKVGIGGGSVCSTRIVTGCGVPTLDSVMDCVTTGFDIVADGGIRNSGDIAKCLAAGAKAVMVGGLLAGTDETPGDLYADQNLGREPVKIISINEHKFKYENPADDTRLWEGMLVNAKLMKKYRGSASKESYEVQGKMASHRAPEGESTLVLYKGPVAPILQELKAGIQSAMSYVNARNLTEFRENAEFIRVTSNGVTESKPHGKK